MERRVTLRDVAKKMGVHLSTAARALRQDPRISEEARKAICTGAAKLGYKPDPMMSAFSAYRQSTRPAAYHGTLAFATNFPTEAGWHSLGTDLYFAGAKERAAQLGYDLQEFWMRAPGMTGKRASQILAARGVQGLLLSPQPLGQGELDLDWDAFSSVAFGYSTSRPRMHLVSTTHFRSVRTLVRRMQELGYRKIGFCSIEHMDERTDQLWSAAFHHALASLPESREIPLCIPPFLTKEEFLKWYNRWKPEAIISSESDYIQKWLRADGRRIPADVGLASVNIQGPHSRHSGIHEKSPLIGRTAVDMLVGMINRAERGIPQDPLRILVEGQFAPGKTLSRVKRA